MARIFGILAVATALVAGPAQADLNDMDKSELHAVIKEYIEANPEVLRDALVGLAQREDEARKTAALELLYMDAGDPVMGNPDGDLTIYEFSDYNCGYCKRIFGPIREVLAEDGNIRFVVKEFPILSQSSLIAAQAAVAAQAQGVFEAFHINMMTGRGAVTLDTVLAAASEAGADIDRLQRDMNSNAINSIIARTRRSAEQLQISGTPGLVIGTTIVPGAIGADELRRLISEERAKRG